MTQSDPSLERHRGGRAGWLRAAVMGANDGIVSTASLVVAVAAADASRATLLLTGVASVVAGAMSMAAGEYVSVCTQRDTERADLARERSELESSPAAEVAELALLYQQRGVEPQLAETVARQMMEHDALGAHARDELGWSQERAARPVQAAVASAATFALGALLPLLLGAFAPAARVIVAVVAGSLLCLALLGGLAAGAGGAPRGRAALRVTFWSALAMALSAAVGAAFTAFHPT